MQGLGSAVFFFSSSENGCRDLSRCLQAGVSGVQVGGEWFVSNSLCRSYTYHITLIVIFFLQVSFPPPICNGVISPKQSPPISPPWGEKQNIGSTPSATFRVQNAQSGNGVTKSRSGPTTWEPKSPHPAIFHMIEYYSKCEPVS